VQNFRCPAHSLQLFFIETNLLRILRNGSYNLRFSPKSYPMNHISRYFKHSAASFCVAQLSEPGDKGLDPKLLQAPWVGKGLYAVPRACVVSQFALGRRCQAPNTSSLAHPICINLPFLVLSLVLSLVLWCFHWSR